MADIRIIGAYLSPYVRKVLACLDLKGLSYEIDPIVAYMGDDRFTSLSPLRRVPVLDYLELQLPAEGFLFGSLGIADISIAVFLRNAALAAAGAPVCPETVGGAPPRRGVMRPA